jgi:hypothetical protein
MPGTNGLAYFSLLSVTKKSFKRLTPALISSWIGKSVSSDDVIDAGKVLKQGQTDQFNNSYGHF